ncbi:beta-1,3-glucosyltransferase isoform X2 [Aricia agestis]|uniref:beta-1,3-glucosyltransferase isoform X2 n=1 Tax=Aricia agestis TaxID=91739 RepID=UPI001C208798|nr:beta-1,3-glucosyltransferase isoform X2 [Aricia agestis]
MDTVAIIFFTILQSVISFDSRDLVFVIVSQGDPYHASVAARLEQDIIRQVQNIEKRDPRVHLTHVDFPVPGAWSIIPLLRPLVSRYNGSARWVLFVEPHTAVRCDRLLHALAAADPRQDIHWIGYPLRDVEPTIIHHFAFYDELEEDGGFVYPHFASGFAMRIQLMASLMDLIESGARRLEADFSIDPAFELAQLVYGDPKQPGPLLTPDHSFCVVSGDTCATYPRQFDTCGSPIPEEWIFFAVKTWSGFHDTRAKVVKKTWGKHVTNLQFYSDKDDPTLPAIDIGVPNSKTGHCVKTVAILEDVLRRIDRRPIRWIFLADDDTILGVRRLCEMLSCYRGGADNMMLGERYGYGYGKKETAGKGYDYITGGGGTVLSVGAARALAACACAGISAPDDMTLGACARAHTKTTIVHSPLFHQARPSDYPREAIARDRPVSFHRHSAPDPLLVYATWFRHDDMAVPRARDEL